ncbi:MAG: hypothetical protein IJ094_12905 [Bacilli bacterium]|nr:hypothetical protein [Bacilli bacterium]
MKVEYIQCDLCGKKILQNDPYYEISVEAKRECCSYNGHTIEICDLCASALDNSNITRDNKVIYLSNNLFRIKRECIYKNRLECGVNTNEEDKDANFLKRLERGEKPKDSDFLY